MADDPMEEDADEAEEEDEVIEVYDALADRRFVASPLFAARHKQEQVGYVRRETEQAKQREHAQKDVLKGIRLIKGKYPPSMTAWIAQANKCIPESWDYILGLLKRFASLTEIPYTNYAVHLNYMHDLTRILEWADACQPLPDSPRELSLERSLSTLGRLMWSFYIKHRATLITTSMDWWLVVMRIRKLAVEKLSHLHGRFLSDYRGLRLGDILNQEANSDARSVRQASDKTNQQWLYLLSTCFNGFVGKRLPAATTYPLDQSTITACVPLWTTRVATNKTKLREERALTHKIKLQYLLNKNDPHLGIRFRDLSLQETWTVVTHIHSRWHELEWTPHAEYLVLLLWHHLQYLILDERAAAPKYDDHQYLKRKVDAQGFRGIANRFIKDIESIMVNELEVIRSFYHFVLLATQTSPVSEDTVLAVRDGEERDTSDAQHLLPLPLTTAGLFDTLCFPACKLFMPSEQFVSTLDDALARLFLKKAALIYNIDSNAACASYQTNVVNHSLVPGEIDTVLSRNPSLMVSAARIVDQNRRGDIPPLAETSFLTEFPLIALAFTRGGHRFSEFRTNPKHTSFAVHAYAAMINAALTVGGCHSEITNLSAVTNGGEISKDMIDKLIDEHFDGGDIFLSFKGADSLAQKLKRGLEEKEQARRKLMKDTKNKKREAEAAAPTHSRKRERPSEHALGNGDGSGKALPIEVISEARDYFVIRDDKEKRLIFSHSLDLTWSNQKEEWPVVIRVRGEYWVLGRSLASPSSAAEFLFLRTTDPIEAHTASYVRGLTQFDGRARLRGALPAILERHLAPLYKMEKEVIETEEGAAAAAAGQGLPPPSKKNKV